MFPPIVKLRVRVRVKVKVKVKRQTSKLDPDVGVVRAPRNSLKIGKLNC